MKRTDFIIGIDLLALGHKDRLKADVSAPTCSQGTNCSMVPKDIQQKNILHYM